MKLDWTFEKLLWTNEVSVTVIHCLAFYLPLGATVFLRCPVLSLQYSILV